MFLRAHSTFWEHVLTKLFFHIFSWRFSTSFSPFLITQTCSLTKHKPHWFLQAIKNVFMQIEKFWSHKTSSDSTIIMEFKVFSFPEFSGHTWITQVFNFYSNTEIWLTFFHFHVWYYPIQASVARIIYRPPIHWFQDIYHAIYTYFPFLSIMV